MTTDTTQTLRIGFVCDDEHTITAHFGHAPLVVVVTLDNGQEVAREIRAKDYNPGEPHGHDHDHDHDHEHEQSGDPLHVPVHEHEHGHEHGHRHDHGHGHGHGGGGPHAKFAALHDCDVMIVGGIGGRGAAYAAEQGIRLLAVRERSVDAALRAYLDGTLGHEAQRIHQH